MRGNVSDDKIPRTMTLSGLKFLSVLAKHNKDGCFLEIGPLFGSSTNAIDYGRQSCNLPIHTIDTFEPAPWVRKRLSIDLSRRAFDEYTSHIQNLHVHQGFSPDCVKDSWHNDIGLYFDDATHGDPGWIDNFNFFSKYFAQDVIICGDDFAGGWPDIINNVYNIADSYGVNFFVIGRVWAFSPTSEYKIISAINEIYPKLQGSRLNVQVNGQRFSNSAASWTYGIHRTVPITSVSLDAPDGFEISITTYRKDSTHDTILFGKETWSPLEAKELHFSIPNPYSLQLCIKNSSGRTINTRDLRGKTLFTLAKGEEITSIRLSHQ